MEALASVFGIDVLTYAIMSNHLNSILRNRPDVVAQWSDEEVAIRWLQVFPANAWKINWPIARTNAQAGSGKGGSKPSELWTKPVLYRVDAAGCVANESGLARTIELISLGLRADLA